MASSKTTRKPRTSDFYRLRVRVGLASIEQASEFCGVTSRTIRNWDRSGAPAVAMRLLFLWDRVDLSGHGAEWRGIRLSKGVLCFGRDRVGPDTLRRIPAYRQAYERLTAARERLERDGVPIEVALRIALGIFPIWPPVLVPQDVPLLPAPEVSYESL